MKEHITPCQTRDFLPLTGHGRKRCGDCARWSANQTRRDLPHLTALLEKKGIEICRGVSEARP